MKNEWTFQQGQWRQTDTLQEWGHGQDFDDWRTQNGFDGNRQLFGNESSGCLEIYENSDKHEWVVLVCPTGDECHLVVLSDLPSYLMFVKEYAPLFVQMDMDWRLEVLVDSIKNLS